MSRAIDADRLLDALNSIILDYTSEGKYPDKFGIDDAINLVEDAPTLTSPNEPLTCAGCYYLDGQCAPCAHCRRAAGYADYYRRLPEGENA